MLKTEVYGSCNIFLLLFLPHFSYFQRRKLDAVYYYMRSLMASNPFQSARESLLSLFDESRKKVSILTAHTGMIISVQMQCHLCR